MEFSVAHIAQQLNGTIIGDKDLKINRPAKIEEAQRGDISFVANHKYQKFAKTSKASVLLIDGNFDKENFNGKTYIQVENVYASLPILLNLFNTKVDQEANISNTSIIHGSASLGKNVSIGNFVVINAGVSIDDGTVIGSNVTINSNVSIGQNSRIYPGVRIYDHTIIGDNCIIHSNAVIGSDGFGFAPTPNGDFHKIPQVGNVVIEDNVEIGSNTVIDRATMGSTIIRKGTKLDNLIQIAHNVEIGSNTVIAAQAGIAGSTKIGKQCMIGGQAGIVGHISIEDGTMIQAQSGVAANIKEKNKKWYGSPALRYGDYLRAFSVFRILPKLLKRIDAIEQKLEKKIND